MKKILLALAILCVLHSPLSTLHSQPYPWQDTTKSIDLRVEWLVRNLTLDEKLSLLVHRNPAIPRVGLPEYSWWNEALHGVGRAGLATVYPMPIAMAATFDPSMIREVFGQVAQEARIKYQQAQDTGGYGDYSGLTFFTPNINIFRDPRWGRGMETYGEDPYLTAMMGLACVEGLQGERLKTAACLKHFAVHSGPEGTRHEFDSRVSERDLRTTYLPAFEYIIKHSDVQQVMCGYNRLNGEPCCTNRRLFDILRNEWQYNGILVTDCWALNDAYETDTVIPRHRTHATAAAAYGDAFGREVDLECGSGLPALREAVQQGLVPESKVDEHVRRVLRTRLQVESGEWRVENTAANTKTLSTDVAARSMVLLKNTGVLPLKGPALLAGPNAYDSLMPLGNYNGTPAHTVTIGEALKNEELRIKNEESAGATNNSSLFTLHSSLVIYCGGLNPQLEGEELPVEKEGFYKGDRTRIELPQDQVEEIKAYKKQGHQVVLVLCTGSAIALENVLDDCDAVLVAWYGGQDMGTAVKQLLYGERDDFGRLPVTFYRSTDQLPSFDDYSMDRRTYRYLDDGDALFPFGFGYSYSFFSIKQPWVSEADFTIGGTASLCNTDVPQAPTHRTVIQVYLGPRTLSAKPTAHHPSAQDGEEPRKQLIATRVVDMTEAQPLQPFTIQLDPWWFRQYNPASGQMEEPADGTEFILQMGFSSDDRDLQDFPFVYHNRK